MLNPLLYNLLKILFFWKISKIYHFIIYLSWYFWYVDIFAVCVRYAWIRKV